MKSLQLLRWVMIGLSVAIGISLMARGNVVLGAVLIALALMRATMFASRQGRRQQFTARRQQGSPDGSGPVQWGGSSGGGFIPMGGRSRMMGGGAAVPVSSITVGGVQRQYIVHRPTSLTGATAVPLVVMLHGGFGSADQAQRAYGWDAAADRHGFVVVYPNGIGRTWNAGTCCGPAMRDGVDDVGFIDALVTELIRAQGIDPTRVYAAGMSNGAMMSYRLACELPGRFAAIGPVAGSMTVHCARAAPTSVCHIHGLADDRVPFSGGVGPRGFAKDARPSIPSVMDIWRAVDGCTTPTMNHNGFVHTQSADGPNGVNVTLITIDGAGHQWPGGRAAPPRAARALGIDPPSTAIDATSTLWQFFAAHPRRV